MEYLKHTGFYKCPNCKKKGYSVCQSVSLSVVKGFGKRPFSCRYCKYQNNEQPIYEAVLIRGFVGMKEELV